MSKRGSFSNRLKAIFRGAEKEPAFNLHHPDVAHKIVFAFECAGKKYYRFGNKTEGIEMDMPTGRYKFYLAFLEEFNLHMTLETLGKYLDVLERSLSGGKGQVNIGDAWETIIKMRSRVKLGFDPDTVKRLASVTFFDETEDLSDYDRAHNEQKMALWDRHDNLGFFLRTPIKELCGLNGISLTDLAEYTNQMVEVIKDLSPDPLTPSSTSS